MSRPLLAAAAAAGLMLGFAPAIAAAAPDACFRLNDIQNTKMQGFRTLYLRASTGRVYRMDFGADCNNVGSEPLILHSANNSGEICHPIDLDVKVRGTGQGCIPTHLSRLTPAEVSAIPPKYRP